MSWRNIAAPIIENVLRTYEGEDEKVIKKALRDAYPFGPRRYFPYKCWLDEIRRQRGILKKRDRAPEEQMGLFGKEGS